MLLRSFLIAALTLTQTAALNRFHSPPPAGLKGKYGMNEVHAVGDEVKFTWETDPIHNQTNLGLWTEFRDQIITKSLWLGRNLIEQEFVWVVTLEEFPRVAAEFGVFYLSIHSFRTGKTLATSHYFNITNPSAATSASSSLTSAATSAPAVDKAVQEDESLTAGMVAGISIGVTLGSVLLVGVGVSLLRRRHQGKKKDADYAPSVQQQHGFVNEPKSPAPLVELSNDMLIELPGNDRTPELGDGTG